jgi:PPK2 family polyphosphate:nucleotide phosphotransferase
MRKSEARKRRASDLERLAGLQERLFAEGTRALLVVLQGLDAAGKDSTIAHVMSGVNPQAVSVSAFKQPTPVELAHDFLWRAQVALPARGRIGVFNRSHYEEMLVVRVHSELLAAEGVDPADANSPKFWERRARQIAAWERHLTDSGTRVLKFFLHVSKEEQVKRFLARAERPEKHWKFSVSDIREHNYWNAYQHAYEDALRLTSTPREPWYVVPADHKWFLRTAVAAIIVRHLSDMDPHYPRPTGPEWEQMLKAAAQLSAEEAAS